MSDLLTVVRFSTSLSLPSHPSCPWDLRYYHGIGRWLSPSSLLSSVHLTLSNFQQKPFACLGVLDCVFNIYFYLMVEILEIFWHMLPHLSYTINKESRKLIGNFLRYNYFLPQVSFEWFCCWQLMSEKCQNWRLLLRCWHFSLINCW